MSIGSFADPQPPSSLGGGSMIRKDPVIWPDGCCPIIIFFSKTQILFHSVDSFFSNIPGMLQLKVRLAAICLLLVLESSGTTVRLSVASHRLVSSCSLLAADFFLAPVICNDQHPNFRKQRNSKITKMKHYKISFMHGKTRVVVYPFQCQNL